MTNSTIKTPADQVFFSPLALGLMRLPSWNLTTGQLSDLVRQCLDLGITTFDHADIYGGYTCENLFGAAIDGRSRLRQQMQLVSKCGIRLVSPNRPSHTMKSYDTSATHIVLSVENSLKALRTDYLDVLLIHRPSPLMHPAEVAEAFDRLQEQGKVLAFGVSNFSPSQADLIRGGLRFPLVTNQVELSVLHPGAFSDGTADHALRHGYPLMAWSPLAGGRLAGDPSAQAQLVRETLAAADLSRYTPEQVALAWLLHHPSRVVPVLGTGQPARLTAAAEAVNISLSTEQWFRIYVAATGRELP